MINRNMRIIVFFDLPTYSVKDKQEYTQFRRYLIQTGFDMLQFSVYSRITRNNDDAIAITKRLLTQIPIAGNVRILQITEKQYQHMILAVGEQTQMELFVKDKDFLDL